MGCTEVMEDPPVPLPELAQLLPGSDPVAAYGLGIGGLELRRGVEPPLRIHFMGKRKRFLGKLLQRLLEFEVSMFTRTKVVPQDIPYCPHGDHVQDLPDGALTTRRPSTNSRPHWIYDGSLGCALPPAPKPAVALWERLATHLPEDSKKVARTGHSSIAMVNFSLSSTRRCPRGPWGRLIDLS